MDFVSPPPAVVCAISLHFIGLLLPSSMQQSSMQAICSLKCRPVLGAMQLCRAGIKTEGFSQQEDTVCYFRHRTKYLDALDAYYCCHCVTRKQSYLLHIISNPSQKSRTLTSEMIAQFRQFTKSTSWSPNSWLKASGFQSSDLSFLCTPETSTGCGNKDNPSEPYRKYCSL